MNIRFTQQLILALGLVISSSSFYAQQAAILYTPNPDSPIEQRNPKAPQELDEFAFLIGDWNVDITWQPKGQKPFSYKGKWHNHWIIDGYAVMQEWRGPYLTGTEIRYYDPKSKKWTGRNLYVNGDWKETTAQMEGNNMIVTIIDAQDKSGSYLNRETYFNIQKNSFEMKSDRSYDDGKTWEKGAYFMKAERDK